MLEETVAKRELQVTEQEKGAEEERTKEKKIYELESKLALDGMR